MSLHAYDWANQQSTTDYVAQSLLVTLGALADADHKSRVSVDELAETIEHPPRTVREILAELEAATLIEFERPVSASGVGLVTLPVVRSTER